MANAEKNNKLNNFIVQGGILAMAGIIARMLGLVKRVPLAYIIQDVGNGYYSAAYEIYNIVLTLSSYAIPLSVSKLVSARISKGQYKNADKIFKCTLIFAFVVGAFSSSMVFIFADKLSLVMNEPMSYMALRVLAPTLFVVAIMGVFRGYFQGQGNMVPTACSQLIEQIVLVAVSLTAASLLTKKGAQVGALLKNENYKYAYGAAGATLGCSIGALASLIFLIYLFKRHYKKQQKKIMRDGTTVIESTGFVYKSLILTIVPVVVSATVNNISNFLDQYIHNRMMIEKGMDAITKATNWGIYSGKYLVLIGVPIAMSNAMGASSVPTLSGLMRNKAYEEARDKIGRIIRITMLISIPCAVGLAVLAPEIMYLLFSSTNTTGPLLVRIGAAGIIFFSFSTLTNAMLQGMSKMSKPIIHGLIALVIHVSILVVLLKFTDWNIYAVAFSNNIFSFTICALNLYSISKFLKYKQEVVRTFITPLLCSGAMAIILFLLNSLLMKNGFSRLLIIIEVFIGIIVYFITMIISRGITGDELRMLPGGTRLYQLFKAIRIMK